ncbi:HSP20 family protein [Haloplanus vescus]|uniref:HSP20 family protein n=1 Tax=Haloplanus vescus TaxID=555874 RepID=A0A1H3VWU4_9EURY|nr:Hsp20/alpha crystallin family protein [Haloplanus vescus]SDZ79161.1 HSP20 family protein [Haloplanus vescus]
MADRNPFDELDELFDQMQRNMERATRMWESEALESTLPGAASMNVDLEDQSDAFVLTGDLPGFETDDIDVRVKDRTLHITAEHDESSEESEGEYVHRERRRTSVERSVPLPSPVDTEGVTASYNNGVLTVRLPKSEPDSDGTPIDVN